jgi:hypothetical protein
VIWFKDVVDLEFNSSAIVSITFKDSFGAGLLNMPLKDGVKSESTGFVSDSLPLYVK